MNINLAPLKTGRRAQPVELDVLDSPARKEGGAFSPSQKIASLCRSIRSNMCFGGLSRKRPSSKSYYQRISLLPWPSEANLGHLLPPYWLTNFDYMPF